VAGRRSKISRASAWRPWSARLSALQAAGHRRLALSDIELRTHRSGDAAGPRAPCQPCGSVAGRKPTRGGSKRAAPPHTSPVARRGLPHRGGILGLASPPVGSYVSAFSVINDRVTASWHSSLYAHRSDQSRHHVSVSRN